MQRCPYNMLAGQNLPMMGHNGPVGIGGPVGAVPMGGMGMVNTGPLALPSSGGMSGQTGAAVAGTGMVAPTAPMWAHVGVSSAPNPAGVFQGPQTMVNGNPMAGALGVQAQFAGTEQMSGLLGSNGGSTSVTEANESKNVEKIQMISQLEKSSASICSMAGSV